MNRLFEKLGIIVPEIMLPSKDVDLAKWAVIACDQYTSQPEYWEEVRRVVGESPSALNLVLPEIYLKASDTDARINRINEMMEHYVNSGVLKPLNPCFILVERSTPHTPSRKGLIMAVDLECYDYSKGSCTLIRATEETVLDRIPPRVKIRENALVELPHIMLLIDDPGKTVIEPLYERTAGYEKLYDFDLMMGGGHIRGWKVDDEDSFSMVAGALAKLAGAFAPAAGAYSATSRDSYAERDIPSGTLLFAVGDGNHSLASAKAHWENVKAALHRQRQGAGVLPGQPAMQENACGGVPQHPARYALVEVMNVHDDGLVFEPIHRILFGIDRDSVLDQLKNAARKAGLVAETLLFESREAMETYASVLADEKSDCRLCNRHDIPFILEGAYGLLTVNNPTSSLEAGTLQAVLDELVNGGAGIEIDYIHGDEAVTGLGSKKGGMGFLLPVMSKYDLFKTVVSDGVLPRKTFSMGEAEEKRYYLECRRIR